jgi:hypothetical protein
MRTGQQLAQRQWLHQSVRVKILMAAVNDAREAAADTKKRAVCERCKWVTHLRTADSCRLGRNLGLTTSVYADAQLKSAYAQLYPLTL